MTARDAKKHFEELVEDIDERPDSEQEKFQEVTAQIADILLANGELGVMAIHYFFWQSMATILRVQEQISNGE